MKIFTRLFLLIICIAYSELVIAQSPVFPVRKKNFSLGRQRKGLILDKIYDNITAGPDA